MLSALTILVYTTVFLITGLFLLSRLISRNWLTPSSITHPVALTENHVVVITGGNCGTVDWGTKLRSTWLAAELL